MALTDSTPILINHDDNFTDYGFFGSGTELEPYLIQDLNISTSEKKAISINDTSLYFTIQNCFLESTQYGIEIRNVADGTVKIIGNTIDEIHTQTNAHAIPLSIK